MAELLRNLPVASTFLLPARLTAKGAGGVTFELLDADRTVTATITVTTAGVVSGSFVADPRDQPVKVVAVAMAVGDVVKHAQTGEVVVVQAVGLGPDGARWSSATSGQPSYVGDGWSKVGSVTLP